MSSRKGLFATDEWNKGISAVGWGDRKERGNAAGRRLWADSSGLAAIEYALLASLIAVTIVGSLALTGNSVSASMNKVQNAERLTAGG